MENLPDTSKTLNKGNDTNDSVNSIADFNFEDLAQTSIHEDKLGRRNLLIWFVVLTASITATLMLFQTGPALGTLQTSKTPEKVSSNLNQVDIEISALFSEQKESIPVLTALAPLSSYDNVGVTFFSPKFSTTNVQGSTNYISTRYIKGGKLHTVEFPYQPDDRILYYDGSLSTKPFITTFKNFLDTVAQGQRITLGFLTGKLTEDEKNNCEVNPELCTIIDVYSKNRSAIDTFANPNIARESTISIQLPVYFVGIAE